MQSPFKAMENGDDYDSNSGYNSSDSSSEGELHWKVDINHDGTLRTRYCYVDKDVIDLTDPKINTIDTVSSIIR